MASKPYAAMQSLLKDQNAAAQAMRDAAESIKNATDMLSVTLGKTANESAPIKRHYDSTGQPIGDRPRMSGNQSQRPRHGSQDYGVGQHGTGINGVRSMVADQLHARVGAGSGPEFQATYDDSGSHTGYIQYNQDGSTTHRKPNEPGIEGEVQQAARRGSRSKIISGFTQGGMLRGARAVPMLGPAVIGAEAVHEGFVQFGKQREANTQYQSIYGGTNLQGMGQRFQQSGFRLGQLFSGGLTGNQSDEAFRGVSRLGFQGQQRGTDLNFISSNYKSMGMGVSESLQLIETASKNLNTSLKGLQDGLKSVTSAAKETGQSAQAARQVFSSNYASIAQANPGVGASGLANAISTQQVGLGRNMQGLNFTQNFTTQGGIAMLSQLSGGLNGPGESMSAFRADVLTGSDKALTANDTLVAKITNRFLTPQVKAAIEQAVSQIPGGRATIKSQPDIVGAQITPKILPLVNSDEILSAFGQMGQTGLDPIRAVTLLIQTYLGQFGNTKGQHDEMMAQKQQNLSKLAPGTSASGNNAVGRGGHGGGGIGTKGVNPVVDDAVSQLKGQHVIVQSAGGARVVSVEEAAKSYTDQIAKGTATMADGNNVGQTVSQALGGEAETNYQGGDTSNYVASKGQTTKTSGLNSDRGMTVDAFNESQKKKADKTAGTVIIQPSQQLLQLLSFQANGNVSIATGGAASNSVPVPGS
jgi:hypothetical protein